VHRKVADLTLAQFKALVCGDKSGEEAEGCSQSQRCATQEGSCPLLATEEPDLT